MNRRGFIGALSGALVWGKSGFVVSPAASAIQPTCKTQCCACGASWHVTGTCPFNITAMGGIAPVLFEGGTMQMAAAFIECQNIRVLRWAEWGGQRVLPIIGGDGSGTGSFVAYALPKGRITAITWPLETAAVVKYPLDRLDGGFLRSA